MYQTMYHGPWGTMYSGNYSAIGDWRRRYLTGSAARGIMGVRLGTPHGGQRSPALPKLWDLGGVRLAVRPKAAKAPNMANKQSKANTSTGTKTATSETQVTATQAADPKKQAAKMRREAKTLQGSLTGLEGAAKASIEQRIQGLLGEAETLDPKPVKVAKAPKAPRPTCTATKKDGTACTAKAMEGRDVCTDHRPAAEHLHETEKAWLGTQSVEQLVAIFGWGQVRQAAKNAGVVVPAKAKAEPKAEQTQAAA